MAINLSNYLNGNHLYQQQINGTEIQQTINQALKQTGQTLPGAFNQKSAGSQILQNMLAGDIFTGHVLEVKENQVSISLSDGSLLSASLNGQTSIQSGQNVTFMVEENQGTQVQLKIMAANEQQAVMFNKALEGAGLPLTSDNLSIVKELFSLNMPVNADTIHQLLHMGIQYPDTELHTIANMMRLDIPVTQENIVQYEAYSRFENNMSDTLASMGEHLLEAMIQPTGSETAAPLMPETALPLLDAFYQTDSGELKSGKLSDSMNQEQLTELADDIQLLGKGAEVEELAAAVKDGNITLKQLISTILSPEMQKTAVPEQMKKLLSSQGMKDAFHQMINETMKLTPQDVKEENAIPEYYNRIRKTLAESEKILEKNGSDTPVQKDMNQVKANIDFMNDLNRNMTFFQMPVKFSESEGNGELYVFTNKKSLQQKGDNVSALLHLDMDNLGPMDIYVKLAGKNVSTNFCLESEEMLDFVNEHIDELNQRLENLGYSTHFEMKVSKQEESFDFEQDFLEKDVHRISGQQLVFDSRV